MIHSVGDFSLPRGVSHASGDVTSTLAISLRLPSLERNVCASRSTSPGGGSSATKCRANL